MLKVEDLKLKKGYVVVRAFKYQDDTGFKLKENNQKDNTRYQNRGEVILMSQLSEDFKDLELGDIIDFKPEGFMNVVILDKNAPKPVSLNDLDPIFLLDEFLIDFYVKKENYGV